MIHVVNRYRQLCPRKLPPTYHDDIRWKMQKASSFPIYLKQITCHQKKKKKKICCKVHWEVRLWLPVYKANAQSYQEHTGYVKTNSICCRNEWVSTPGWCTHDGTLPQRPSGHGIQTFLTTTQQLGITDGWQHYGLLTQQEVEHKMHTQNLNSIHKVNYCNRILILLATSCQTLALICILQEVKVHWRVLCIQDTVHHRSTACSLPLPGEKTPKFISQSNVFL